MSQDYDENDFDDYTPIPDNDWWEAQKAIKAEQDPYRKRSMLREYERKHGPLSAAEKVSLGLSALSQ